MLGSYSNAKTEKNIEQNPIIKNEDSKPSLCNKNIRLEKTSIEPTSPCSNIKDMGINRIINA